MKSIQQRRQALISQIEQLQREINNLNNQAICLKKCIEAAGDIRPEWFDSELQWCEKSTILLPGQAVVYLGGRFM